MSIHRDAFLALPASERHRRLIARHVATNSAGSGLEAPSEKEFTGFFSRSEEAEIRQKHRFIRSSKESESADDSWATRLAKKYYERLFKEYCIVDLSLYEYGCLGTRWRTETEVRNGKGQFICASTKCSERASLGTYEINFSYSEEGVKKQALVKVRVCHECMDKMNYKRTVLKMKVRGALRKGTNKRTNRDGEKQEKAKKKKRTQKGKDKPSQDTKGQTDDTDLSDSCLDDLFV